MHSLLILSAAGSFAAGAARRCAGSKVLSGKGGHRLNRYLATIPELRDAADKFVKNGELRFGIVPEVRRVKPEVKDPRPPGGGGNALCKFEPHGAAGDETANSFAAEEKQRFRQVNEAICALRQHGFRRYGEHLVE